MRGFRTDRVRTQRERIQPCIAPSLCVFRRSLRFCPVFCGKSSPLRKGSLLSRGFFDRDLPIEKSEDAVSILKIITSAVFLQKNRQFRTELPTCCTILPFCAPYIIQHPRESLPKLCFTLRATLLLDDSACDFGAVRVSCSAFPPNDFVRPKGHSCAKRRNYRNCPKNIDKIGKM